MRESGADPRPCLIDGVAVPTPDAIDVLDPSTGRLLDRVARGGAAEIDQAVTAARAAYAGWRGRSAESRAGVLRRTGELIRRDLDDLADLESHDTGKPLAQARADTGVAARYFEYYASVVEAFFGHTLPDLDGYLAWTRHEPYGVTGHIIPWNYPLQIGARTMAPALAVGNCLVVKPAEEAPLSVLRIGELALEAGLPPGVLNVVPGLGAEAGAALAAHPGIDHLSFIGSVPVGEEVAAAAARNIVPVALELGGKSPHVVLPDADLDLVVPTVVRALLQNAGQTCSAGSRLLVHAEVHEELMGRLEAALAAVRIGPGPADLDLGPLISARQLARVTGMVEAAAGTAGPRIGGPGRVPTPAEGFFFPPTVFDRVDPAAEIAREEVFGPVLATSVFKDADEAVALANGTAYGLIAAVWTTDLDTAHHLVAELRAGQVYVNAYGAGGGVELPFGGFGKSGYGREKGFEALAEMCQTKTVVMRVPPRGGGPR
ncbi:aldehyde dehydrogenase family protein [Nocardioides pantholopis]|uniref:aldehyde dehydrogenase family protein n=1 Tax=Nocardioides pantholopis TaxID=2483798 RepID=UPI0019D110C5|nr:aldehyde dehydrogenase family protein [Nocardioides pantholopis]